MIKNKFIGSKGESIYASYSENTGKLEIKISDGQNTLVFNGEGTHAILKELHNFLAEVKNEINKNSQTPTRFSKKFLGMVDDKLLKFLSKKLQMTKHDITVELTIHSPILLKPHIINDCARILNIQPNEVWE